MGRFDSLSDLDFEELVADLLRVDSGLPYRAGTRGSDGGIDVLARIEGQLHAAQCKHYRESTYAQLKSAAKHEAKELAAREYSFASYRFATSKPLNDARRRELAEILAPWVTDESDVLGGNDVEGLLREHPAVEARHVKLWLSGMGSLQAMLGAAAQERSTALLEQTKAALPRYVETEAFYLAREIISREGVCVIAGPPGVGKTTLARLLLVDGLESHFQPYEIVPGGMADAWQLLGRDEQQIFYFDDFLGRTALDETRGPDADILNFIGAIAGDRKRRFVLTTREYILRQAKRISEVLDREASEQHRFLLTIDKYTRGERARIFYNHIYHSKEVDMTARRALLANRGYFAVIDHDNYSPRLIEWVTGWSAQNVGEDERSNYVKFCVDVLDHPDRLWVHAFEVGLGGHDRVLLVSLLGLSRRVDVRDLEAAFTAACAARNLSVADHAYTRSLQVLDDSFLVSTQDEGAVYLSVINPSLIDFLRSYVIQSRADAKLCIEGARFFEQVSFLWRALPKDREDLTEVFSDAFQRSFEVPLARGDDPDRPWFEIDGSPRARLGELRRYLKESETLTDECHGWLISHINGWLDRLLEDPARINMEDINLVGDFGAFGFIDLDRVGGALKQKIQTVRSRIDRWDRLDDLRRIVPAVFTDEEWVAEGKEFEVYADDALNDVAGYLEDIDGLDLLEVLAESFGVDLNELQLEEVRGSLLEEDEEKRERGWKPETDHDFEDDVRDMGGDDRDIDAMFGRLAEQE